MIPDNLEPANSFRNNSQYSFPAKLFIQNFFKVEIQFLIIFWVSLENILRGSFILTDTNRATDSRTNDR